MSANINLMCEQAHIYEAGVLSFKNTSSLALLVRSLSFNLFKKNISLFFANNELKIINVRTAYVRRKP
jgi:hypothetical protein